MLMPFLGRVTNIWLPLINFCVCYRRHFYRRFPKTVKLVNDMNKSGKFNAFQYFKYHSLGPFTTRNAAGLFGGASSDQNDIPVNQLTPIWHKY